MATPVGMIIGMIVGSEANDLMNVVFNALAAGTFFYIACSEVIVEEFSVGKYKWWKMLAFSFGAGLIVGLGLLEAGGGEEPHPPHSGG
jgi:zinc transporter ZupT